MISTDPVKLAEEIEHAERERDKHLSTFKGQIKSYTSPFWNSKEGESPREGEYSPENHYYEYVSNVVPQVVYSNPRVSVRSRVFGADGDMTLMRYFLNTWIMDNVYGEFLDPVAHDICFSSGVILTTIEDHPYMLNDDGEPAKIAKQHRISPRMYGRDAGALEKDGARFEFHEWHIDKEDLVQRAKDEEGWNTKEIEALAANEAPDQHRANRTPDRKELKCYDIWIRDAFIEDSEEGPEDGFHGIIVTVAEGKGDEGTHLVKIREDRPFYGPPWGPYAFEQIHVVPDESWGLSPLTATEGQTRDLNRHARAASDRAARRKRPIIIDEQEDGSVAEQIRDMEDDEVVAMPNFDTSKVSTYEFGGVTDQDLAYLELARNRLERVSGLTEVMRGQAGSADSATEAAIAAEGANLRVEYFKLKFQRIVRKALRTVAWYFHNDEDMRHVVSPEAAEELGIPLPPGDFLIIEGGNPQIPFDQLAIEIEPMSMERVTTASNQRKTMEMFGVVVQVAQMVPQMPYVKWDSLLDMIGEVFNVPRLGELIDVQAASQMMGMPVSEGAGEKNLPKQIAQNASIGSPGKPTSDSYVSRSGFSGNSLGQETRQNLVA